jgi:hypothetical protein
MDLREVVLKSSPDRKRLAIFERGIYRVLCTDSDSMDFRDCWREVGENEILTERDIECTGS